MKRIIFLLIFFAFFSRSLCQDNLKRFIIDSSIKINTIDPENRNNLDLEVIRKSIGNSRIVMLGEQDHGDAPTYLAKARLIKYLHDSLKFNVIAFESDFFALNRGWNPVLNGKMKIKDYFNSIYTIWTLCKQCNNIFEYITNLLPSKNPLIVTGFDSFLGEYSRKHYKSVLIQFLKDANIPFINEPIYSKNFWSLTDSILKLSKNGKITAEEQPFVEKMNIYFIQILNQLKSQHYSDYFEYLTLESVLSDCRVLLYAKRNEIVKSISERDHQMAKNLNWLINVKYPKQKIIVWAANSHIMRNPINERYPLPMVNYLTKMPSLKDSIYVIGFTDFSGSAGRVYSKNYNIASPAKESLESWLQEKQYNFAFINFKNGKKLANTVFSMRGQDHYQIKSKWMSIFDGVFYIKNMYPCHVN